MQSSMESQSITIMCSTQCHLTPHPKTGKYFIQPLGIGIDAAGKSTEHDDAANLVTQACSGHHLDKLREPDMTAFGSTVELRLNASSDCTAREGAIISEHNRGLRASETRLVACAIAFNARHKRALGMPSRYTKARHLPCALSWRGAFTAAHVREGYSAGRSLMSWANNAHRSPKVR